MKESVYLRNKSESYQACGANLKDKKLNCHHIQFRRDVRKLPKGYPLNESCNLVPLPIKVHEELHQLIDNNPVFKKDLTLRVYFANMAFCGDLCDVPDRLYRVNPVEIMKRRH